MYEARGGVKTRPGARGGRLETFIEDPRHDLEQGATKTRSAGRPRCPACAVELTPAR